VPDDALALSRAKQMNKEGWAARFRRAMSAKKDKIKKG
jgi:bifunctional UDP-N-acetylglucosamine pyrophosphorylase/glucosamine-1-phosphate N-acetyltransferase